MVVEFKVRNIFIIIAIFIISPWLNITADDALAVGATYAPGDGSFETNSETIASSNTFKFGPTS
jgi:hypothetical protein